MVSGNGIDLGLRRMAKKSLRSRSVSRNGTERRPEPRFEGSGGPHRGPETGLQQVVEPGVACSFGATCVGVLLQRMRLHLSTQRFLAERRGDRIWEASCDYAALSLERIGARLRPGMFEQPLFAKSPQRAPRKRSRARGGR